MSILYFVDIFKIKFSTARVPILVITVLESSFLAPVWSLHFISEQIIHSFLINASPTFPPEGNRKVVVVFCFGCLVTPTCQTK